VDLIEASYIYIERERGMEGEAERERDIYRLMCLRAHEYYYELLAHEYYYW
jgi:hypothetical protein